MKITSHTSKIKTVRQGDSLFTLRDGFITASRASFEIVPQCPYEYKLIIQECVSRGWLKPVAHILNKELAADILCG